MKLLIVVETATGHTELLPAVIQKVKKAVKGLTEMLMLSEDTELLLHIGGKEEFIWNL